MTRIQFDNIGGANFHVLKPRSQSCTRPAQPRWTCGTKDPACPQARDASASGPSTAGASSDGLETWFARVGTVHAPKISPDPSARTVLKFVVFPMQCTKGKCSESHDACDEWKVIAAVVPREWMALERSGPHPQELARRPIRGRTGRLSLCRSERLRISLKGELASGSGH